MTTFGNFEWFLIFSTIGFFGLVPMMLLLYRDICLLDRETWNSRIRENRRVHPDLIAREERGEKTQKARFAIAQEMMMRERDALRAMGKRESDVRYPDVWDFYIVSSNAELRVAQERRKAREADMEKLRRQTRTHATV